MIVRTVLIPALYTLQYSVLLISTHNKLALRINGSYGLMPKELDLVSKLMYETTCSCLMSQ